MSTTEFSYSNSKYDHKKTFIKKTYTSTEALLNAKNTNGTN
jgi:hypothetical protein